MDYKTIALIGGTGNLGKGLALRWARSSLEIVIGSRYREKAEMVASQLTEIVGRSIIGLTNEEASKIGEIIVLTIPFEGLRQILGNIYPNLDNKIVISTIVAPIDSTKSAGEIVKELTPKSTQVASAFQNIGYKALLDLDADVECDVIVCGDEKAKKICIELAEKISGVRALDGGPIENSRIVENLTHLLIYLSKKYKKKSPCIRLSGI
ncbi:MAG: NADPH-dependent F420 reductase [Aigarchaeota archaeon]|nr:NADPH-dependent F420 reductase [Aigarchaeota archaeon]MCX8193322.1 NADPH-dependent F420 reductase [Nitrososphaeria archaeon]MDW7986541.1 NADPH-dependent F420 reductase [Nitrososphaerota archaeon]